MDGEKWLDKRPNKRRMNMSKQIVSPKLPDDLIRILKSGSTTVVVASFSEKGVPHTTPISLIYPKGLESLLITIHKDSEGYHNMVWQKKVMICVIDEENVAYSILGRAGVVRAPSMIHPLMNVVRIDLIDVKNNRSVLLNVHNGIRCKYTSADAEELYVALMRELKELSATL